MGKLIYATAKTVPETLKNKFASIACDFNDLGAKETNAEYFGECVRVGSQTSIGAQILSNIASGGPDIAIVPVVSEFEATSSQFLPKVPCVIINILDFGNTFVPDANPVLMRPTVLLFHELGHASQWLTRRGWFDGASLDQIERDNLVRHEQPLCRALGEPIRMHYLDTYDSADKAKERWVQMNAAATTIQRAARAFLARKAK
jgi:hypothetical protein